MARDELSFLYAKDMEHFGCGTALFQPVSAKDMPPPCIGYIDENGTWNFIACLRWPTENSSHPKGDVNLFETADSSTFQLLERKPRKLERLLIEWRVRTSIGVRQWNVDVSRHTPKISLPTSAHTNIKYKSNTNFGAVLIAQKPITLTAYNDETLFGKWLDVNKPQLLALYGTEMRRYGLHIVTKTYTTPACSINAWVAKDKEVNISMKVKASMLGELAGDLNWTETLNDKDWSHYRSKEKDDTIVVFFDGIEVPSREWWWQSLKSKRNIRKPDNKQESKCGSPPPRTHSQTPVRRPGSLRSPKDTTRDLPSSSEKDLQPEDLWGSPTPFRKSSPPLTRIPSLYQRSLPRRPDTLTRSVSTPKRLSRYLDYEQRSPAVHFSPHPSVRISAPDPPGLGEPVGGQRLSRASTNTSMSSVRRREPRVYEQEVGQQGLAPRSALQRKPAPPALRHTN